MSSEFGDFDKMFKDMAGASKKTEEKNEIAKSEKSKGEKPPRKAAPDAHTLAKVEDLEVSVRKLTDMVKNLELELEVSPKMNALDDTEATAIQALYDDVKNRYKGKESKWQQTPFKIVEELLKRHKKG